MCIVFYSTNSNAFDEENFKISVLPSNETAFKAFCASHSDCDFFCVTQKPGMFLPEYSAASELSNVFYLPQETDTQAFADFILSLKPDLAIALTFWTEPFDWLTISDSLVAQKLQAQGIKTICHSVETSLICFDKWRTHNELLRLGFEVPRAVFSDHNLYFCAGSNREVLRNVYKESLLSQIKNLKLPLIIKDTTGLSSYGMTVVHTYGEAAGYLNSKRNNSNRLIQEFISGRQFGLEIYGVPGNYTVLPPFEFSVNQYGITSPKQSIKTGPFELPDELRKMMLKLAENLKFYGCAQVDLILDEEGKWHIIEINPRLSGMSYTYEVLCNVSVFELIYKSCVEKTQPAPLFPFVLNLKLPLMSENQMKDILQIEGVKLLNQTNDLAAKQEREKGFCECIIAGKEKSVLENAISDFEKIFGEDTMLKTAKKAVSNIVKF